MVTGTIKNTCPEPLDKVWLTLPVHDLCPLTHEPLEGSIVEIIYTPNEYFLRMRVLYDWITELKEKPLDLETFIQAIALETKTQLGVSISVIGRFILTGGIRLEVFHDAEVDLL